MGELVECSCTNRGLCPSRGAMSNDSCWALDLITVDSRFATNPVVGAPCEVWGGLKPFLEVGRPLRRGSVPLRDALLSKPLLSPLSKRRLTIPKPLLARTHGLCELALTVLSGMMLHFLARVACGWAAIAPVIYPWILLGILVENKQY